MMKVILFIYYMTFPLPMYHPEWIEMPSMDECLLQERAIKLQVPLDSTDEVLTECVEIKESKNK